MTGKILYWATVLMSCAILLMVVSNAALMKSNRLMQDEINRRQMSIDGATRISPMNEELAQALAQIVVAHNDADIRNLLASQGISVHAQTPNDPAASSSKGKM